MQQDYGFMTNKKMTILKAKISDISDIAKLYRRENYKEKQHVVNGWKGLIAMSQNDFTNVIFVIRDKCQHVIGLLEMEETEKAKNFDVEIWIPNKAKQTQYLEHIKESFLEWVEDETDIEVISAIKVIKEMKKNPQEIQYETIGDSIVFEVVSC